MGVTRTPSRLKYRREKEKEEGKHISTDNKKTDPSKRPPGRAKKEDKPSTRGECLEANAFSEILVNP
jgi:hypothetical protein